MNDHECIGALNAALDIIEALNRSIDAMIEWQDDVFEVDPDIDTKIKYLRELRQNVNNSKPSL